MRRRSRLALAAALTVSALSLSLSLTACGGRTDGGSPIPTEATTTSVSAG